MKPVLSLVAVAATALATAPSAEVFIFDATPTTTDAPELSKEVARLILAHRLRDAPDETGPGVPSADLVNLDAHVNTFGKPRQSLFSTDRIQREPQLVIFVEGATPESIASVRSALDGTAAAFTISNPPSATANHHLLAAEFSEYTGTWAGPESCPLDLAINSNEPRCWKGDSLVVSYDALKDIETVSRLASYIPRFHDWARSGELEITLVILPESSRNSGIDTWGPKLKPRQESETVMHYSSEPAKNTHVASIHVAAAGPISIFSPGVCYTSSAKCMSLTYGCWNKNGDCKEVASGSGCWRCSCTTKTDDDGVNTTWTGPMCQQADVSIEFWTFFGVGLVLLVSVGGAMTLLVGVGNEPLPGVLGAGIVKTR